MNIRFFLTELKHQLVSFVFWLLCLGLLLTVFVSNFPSVSAFAMNTLLNIDFSAFPEEITSRLNIAVLPDLSEFLEYFAFFGQLITVSICFYASSLGVNALSRDIGDGTMEFLSAQPVSRMQILLVKLASRITTLFAFNFVLCFYALVLSSTVVPDGMPFARGITAIFFTSFLSQLFFMMIGFCVSSFWSNAAQSSSFSMALVFFSVLLGVLSPLLQETQWLRALSPYHLSSPMAVVSPGYSFPFVGWLMLFLGGGALFGLSYLRFYKRDLYARG